MYAAVLLIAAAAPGAEPLPTPVFARSTAPAAGPVFPAGGPVVIVGDPEAVVSVSMTVTGGLSVTTGSGNYQLPASAVVRSNGKRVRAMDVAVGRASAGKCVVTSTAGSLTEVSFDGLVDGPPAPTTVVTSSYSSQTTRAAVGHTHTCRNGHTWDHSQDGGSHRCPTCGEYQFVVDSFTRPVQAAPTYSLPGASGGCATGNCPAPTYSRPRLFGR